MCCFTYPTIWHSSTLSVPSSCSQSSDLVTQVSPATRRLLWFPNTVSTLSLFFTVNTFHPALKLLMRLLNWNLSQPTSSLLPRAGIGLRTQNSTCTTNICWVNVSGIHQNECWGVIDEKKILKKTHQSMSQYEIFPELTRKVQCIVKTP